MEAEKTRRYDRQLRLWAASGQSLLESSHACLINATSMGCEALKNLVLPGCGQFTILDDAVVSPADLCNNFFLSENDLGQPRATSALKYLLDLNPNVSGMAEVSSWPHNRSSDFWKRFSVVVVCGGTAEDVERLSQTLWALKIPLVRLLTSGFYASLKISNREVALVDSHMELKSDLRIDAPWPELLEHVESINFEDLVDTEHAHIPPIIVAIRALKLWNDNNGKVPSSRKEKDELQAVIKNLQRGRNEQNFLEAVDISRKLTSSDQLCKPLEHYFNALSEIDWSSPETAPFWFYVLALSRFVEQNDGLPPLAGEIPDMAADTKSYVELQKIYRRKAESDLAKYYSILSEVLSEFGRPITEFTLENVRLFCKNCRQALVQTGTRDQISSKLSSQSDSLTKAVYAGLLAFADFTMKPSPEAVQSSIISLYKANGVSMDDDDAVYKVSTEISRTFGSEMANIASLMGGIAAQEIIKLLTNQYVPLDNCLVFDGIRSVTSSFKI